MPIRSLSRTSLRTGLRESVRADGRAGHRWLLQCPLSAISVGSIATARLHIHTVSRVWLSLSSAAHLSVAVSLIRYSTLIRWFSKSLSVSI